MPSVIYKLRTNQIGYLYTYIKQYIKKFNDKIKDSNYEFKTLGVPESELLQLEDGRLISKTEYDSYKNDFVYIRDGY